MDDSGVAGRVRDGYDVIAEQFLELVARPRATDPRMEWIDDLLGRLRVGSSVLDLGCGPGVPTAATFVRHGHRVTGVDISPRQVELARANVPLGRFLVGDVLESSFKPRSFDAILALFALTHVPRHGWESLFAQCAEWLQPHGWLLATFGMSDCGGFDEEDFLGLGHSNWTNGFAPETSMRLVANAGFAIDRVEIVDHESPFGPERWLWLLGHTGSESQTRSSSA